MKRCCMCKAEKASYLFYRDRSQKDGLSSRCKECNKLHFATRQKKKKMEFIPDDIQRITLDCRHCGSITRAVYIKMSEYEKMKDKFLCNYCKSQVESDSLIYNNSASRPSFDIRPSELPFISS